MLIEATTLGDLKLIPRTIRKKLDVVAGICNPRFNTPTLNQKAGRVGLKLTHARQHSTKCSH